MDYGGCLYIDDSLDDNEHTIINFKNRNQVYNTYDNLIDGITKRTESPANVSPYKKIEYNSYDHKKINRADIDQVKNKWVNARIFESHHVEFSNGDSIIVLHS